MKQKIMRYLILLLKGSSLVIGLKAVSFIALLPADGKFAALAVFIFAIASTFKEGLHLILDFMDDGKLNKSFKLPPLAILAFLVPVVLLASCATRPDGTRTFAGLSAPEWGQVGKDAGKAAVTNALPAYLAYRNGGKGSFDVQPSK